MTPEQEKQLRIQAGQRGYSRDQVEAFVQFAKSKEPTTTQTSTPEFPQPGGLKNFVRELVLPFARGATSVYNIGAGAVEGARTFAREGAQGDYSKASQQLEATRVLPIAGATKPLTTPLQGFGAGAEIGSWLVGGGEAKAAIKGLSIAKSTFGKAVVQAAASAGKSGAATGALASGGRAAQEDTNPLEIGKSALKGAAFGGAAGAGIGGAIGGFGATTRAAQRVGQKLNADDSIIQRTARRIEDAFAKRDALKAQPPIVQTAAKTGISPETSHFILNSQPTDKQAFRSMLEMADNAKKTLRPTSRPVEIPGRAIIERVRHIDTIRKIAGQDIGRVVREMPSTAFVPENALSTFRTGLEEMGITLARGGRLNFTQSAITGADEQRLLQRIAIDLKLGAPKSLVNGGTSHTIRQRIFNMLNLGKQQGQLGSYSEVLANKTREALKLDIIKNSGSKGQQYAQASERYAKTERALTDFYALIGKKWQGKSDELLSLRAGEVGNRILGNASANPLDIIGRLEDIAKEFGFKGQNNPIDQLIFNDLLEDLLGSTQTRSLRGQVGRGVKDAGLDPAGIATDVATANVPGMLKKAVDFARGITPEEQLRVLRELLR